MEMFLNLITLGMFIAMAWNKSPASIWFFGLYFAHYLIFKSWNTEEGMIVYATAAGMTHSITAIICVHLTKNIYEDNVPYWLAWVSVAMSLTSATVIYAYLHIDAYMGVNEYLGFDVFNPVLIGLGLAAIAAMIAGGRGELNRTRILFRHSMSYRLRDASTNNPNRKSNSKVAKS